MTLSKYILGFLLSIALTLISASLVSLSIDSVLLTAMVVLLALVQFVVQLICFLHVGNEKSPRYNLMAFAFALIVVVILVGGTLWIMSNLQHQLT